jgi:hypothetical protein
MSGISWTDLNLAEQHAIAVLGAGISPELCNGAAFLALRRAGLIQGVHLTPKAERLRQAAVLETLHNAATGKTSIA